MSLSPSGLAITRVLQGVILVTREEEEDEEEVELGGVERRVGVPPFLGEVVMGGPPPLGRVVMGGPPPSLGGVLRQVGPPFLGEVVMVPPSLGSLGSRDARGSHTML